jgi:hypothetical protein
MRLDELLSRTGPVHYVGSCVSGLMAWRDLDVMVLVHPGFGPPELVGLLAELVALPGLAGFDVHDERGHAHRRDTGATNAGIFPS